MRTKQLRPQNIHTFLSTLPYSATKHHSRNPFYFLSFFSASLSLSNFIHFLFLDSLPFHFNSLSATGDCRKLPNYNPHNIYYSRYMRVIKPSRKTCLPTNKHKKIHVELYFFHRGSNLIQLIVTEISN